MSVIYWLADGAQADLVLANIHCLCSFRPSFLPCCNGFGLLPPSLVPSAFSEKILFWDQMRYFGRPLYSGRFPGVLVPRPAWAAEGWSLEASCGPCSCNGAFKLQFY